MPGGKQGTVTNSTARSTARGCARDEFGDRFGRSDQRAKEPHSWSHRQIAARGTLSWSTVEMRRSAHEPRLTIDARELE
jgi:hypothetical protein